MCSDFISLCLQGAGGGLSATANTPSSANTGRYIMIAGLAFQVLSLGIFLILWLEFIMRLRKAPDQLKDERFSRMRTSNSRFRWFQCALILATILILIRSIYRVVELQGGFAGTIASNEPAFMVLEGPMIFVAVLALTILHPGFSFGGNWHAAAWSLRGRKSGVPKNDRTFKEEVDSS